MLSYSLNIVLGIMLLSQHQYLFKQWKYKDGDRLTLSQCTFDTWHYVKWALNSDQCHHICDLLSHLKEQKPVSTFMFSQPNIWNSKELQCCSEHPSEETKDWDSLNTRAHLYTQPSSADVNVRTLIILVNSNVTLINRNILNLDMWIERKKKGFII